MNNSSSPPPLPTQAWLRLRPGPRDCCCPSMRRLLAAVRALQSSKFVRCAIRAHRSIAAARACRAASRLIGRRAREVPAGASRRPVRGGEFIVHLRGARAMAANGHVTNDLPESVVPGSNVALAEAIQSSPLRNPRMPQMRATASRASRFSTVRSCRIPSSTARASPGSSRPPASRSANTSGWMRRAAGSC